MTLFLCGLHIRKNPLFAAFCVKSEFLYIYGKIMRGQHEQPYPARLAEKQTKFAGSLMRKKRTQSKAVRNPYHIDKYKK